MYAIKIIYDTGNSFGRQYDVETVLDDVQWKNLDAAEEALNAIEEHYAWYLTQKRNWDVNKQDKEHSTVEAKTNYWYYEKYPENWLYVKTDDGTLIQIDAFWTGYFESLVGGEVVTIPNPNLSFWVNR